MVSIIIPAYNAEKFIERSLGCCVKQTYKDIEIIVVNDGSKDATHDIVNQIKSKDSRVRLIDKENGGLVSARKEALKHANGEYVFFFDADDIIDNETIEKLVSYTPKYDIVIADFVLESEKGKLLPCQHKNKENFGSDQIGTYCNYLSKSVTASLCGRLIKTEFLKDFSTPLDVTMGEDVITNLLIVSKHSPSIKIVNHSFYHYIQYPTSMANTKNYVTLMKRIKYAEWVLNFMKAEQLDNDVKLRPHLCYLLMDELYSFLRDGGKCKWCQSFCSIINEEFWNRSVLQIFPIWKRMLLMGYHHSEGLGDIVRFLLNKVRRFVKR